MGFGGWVSGANRNISGKRGHALFPFSYWLGFETGITQRWEVLKPWGLVGGFQGPIGAFLKSRATPPSRSPIGWALKLE